MRHRCRATLSWDWFLSLLSVGRKLEDSSTEDTQDIIQSGKSGRRSNWRNVHLLCKQSNRVRVQLAPMLAGTSPPGVKERIETVLFAYVLKMDTKTVRFTMNVVCFSRTHNSVDEVRIRLLLYLSQFNRIIGTKDFSTVPKTVCVTLSDGSRLKRCGSYLCVY